MAALFEIYEVFTEFISLRLGPRDLGSSSLGPGELSSPRDGRSLVAPGWVEELVGSRVEWNRR